MLEVVARITAISLSYLTEYIEQMVLDVQMKDEITPTLRIIVDQFDEDNRRPTDHVFQKPEEQNDATCSSSNVFDAADTFENCSTWDQDDDYGDTSVVVEDSNCVDPTVPMHAEVFFLHVFIWFLQPNRDYYDPLFLTVEFDEVVSHLLLVAFAGQ